MQLDGDSVCFGSVWQAKGKQFQVSHKSFYIQDSASLTAGVRKIAAVTRDLTIHISPIFIPTKNSKLPALSFLISFP